MDIVQGDKYQVLCCVFQPVRLRFPFKFYGHTVRLVAVAFSGLKLSLTLFIITNGYFYQEHLLSNFTAINATGTLHYNVDTKCPLIF